ncbi:MAG: acetate--CoA ligase family protein [Bacteroidales bacterium]|nr:acetate--CoA ligase family protein [Bacteroidales bacterium]
MSNFILSKFYFYSGPNYYLNKKAFVFNLFVNKHTQLEKIYDVVTKRFKKIRDYKIYDIADFFAVTLLNVLKMDVDLYINDYEISYDGDEYVIALEYFDKSISKDCAFLVSDWFKAIENNVDFNFEERYEKIKQRFNKTLYGGPTLYSIVEAALKHQIPLFYIYEENTFQWGYGRRQLRGKSALFHTDSIKDAEFTMYKDMVGEFLEMCNFPVPKSITCFTEKEVVKAAEEIGFPVIIKPVVDQRKQTTIAKLSSIEEVKNCFNNILKTFNDQNTIFDGVLVQKYIKGVDYRLLTIDGKFVAATKRIPAYIVGDGKSTIKELIDKENEKIIRADNLRSPLCKIKIDDKLVQYLSQQNLTLESVIEKDKTVYLRSEASISEGGISINVTDSVHPDNIKLVENIAKFFKVKCLGIDILTSDISVSWQKGNFVILEINSNPGIFMHFVPAFGEKIDVPKKILFSHFSQKDKGRIPIVVFNYINKSFAKDLVDELIYEYNDVFIGCLIQEGIFFNNEYFSKKLEHDQAVKIILRHPDVNIAIFEHSKDDIYDYGIFHQGADIIVLDEPAYAEERVLSKQVMDGSILIYAQSGKINVYSSNDDVLDTYEYFSTREKEQIIKKIIRDEMEYYLKKYDV